MKFTFIVPVSLLASSVSIEADMAGDVVAVDDIEPPPFRLSTGAVPPSEIMSSLLEPIDCHSG